MDTISRDISGPHMGPQVVVCSCLGWKVRINPRHYFYFIVSFSNFWFIFTWFSDTVPLTAINVTALRIKATQILLQVAFLWSERRRPFPVASGMNLAAPDSPRHENMRSPRSNARRGASGSRHWHTSTSTVQTHSKVAQGSATSYRSARVVAAGWADDSASDAQVNKTNDTPKIMTSD